jgi:glycosyltransferase involved in cell wall biosynthesis
MPSVTMSKGGGREKKSGGFSVVITTYNEEENIARLLDSIQKLKPTEIIIVESEEDIQ